MKPKIKKNISKIILFIVFVCIFKVSNASTYYVSPTGNNSNAGTISNPWLTINYSQSQLVAGDTLFVRGGLYIETVFIGVSGTNSNPINILAYLNEIPIIDGQTSLPNQDWEGLLTLYGSYLNVSGFEIRNSNVNGTVQGGVGIHLDSGMHNKISFMKVYHIREQGIIVEADNAIVEDCEVYDCALSNINLNMPVGWANGISIAKEQSNGITDNVVVRRCKVYNNYGEGINAFVVQNVTVEDCICYDNWTMNLYLNDATNCTLQRNICYNSDNSTFPKRDGEFTGITLADEISNGTTIPHSANNKVINNFLYNANLDAFWWSLIPNTGLDNVLIANNTVINGNFHTGHFAFNNIINVNSSIINNIFTGNVLVPDNQGLTFSSNNWLTTPPTNAMGNGDVIGNPLILSIGNTNAGQLTGDYFKLTNNSPCIQSGIVLTDVSQDFFENNRDNLPDIGGHEFSIVLSIEQNNFNNEIKVFPNPNKGIFYISLKNSLIEDATINIYNNLGLIVYKETIKKQDLINKTEIRLNSIATGVYFIKIISNNQTFTKRIIISKME